MSISTWHVEHFIVGKELEMRIVSAIFMGSSIKVLVQLSERYAEAVMPARNHLRRRADSDANKEREHPELLP